MLEQNWQPAKSDHVRLIARGETLSPVRIASVFAERTDTGGPVLTADDGQTEVLDKRREVVLLDDTSPTDGCTYYEQLHVATGWIKLGTLVGLLSSQLYGGDVTKSIFECCPNPSICTELEILHVCCIIVIRWGGSDGIEA